MRHEEDSGSGIEMGKETRHLVQAQSLLLRVILKEDAIAEMGPAKQDRGNILLFVPNLIG